MRKPLLSVLGLALLFFVPLGCGAVGSGSSVPFYAASRELSGQSPDPATTPGAVVQVFAAGTVGWRGAFGVHTWVAVKRAGAQRYTRYEVMGWGVDCGGPAVRVDRMGPDNYWFGPRPELLAERRGPEVDALIERIETTVRDYPYPATYVLWPGPNSNTFTAHIGRAVPELRLALPANAIGKDYLPRTVVAVAPSGTGAQVSLFDVLGLMLAAKEGVELNLLGLTVGVDVLRPALKLPGIGRLGMAVTS